MAKFTLHHGDSLEVLKGIPDNSIDSVVTDPPYGLGKEPDAIAMLKDWMQKKLIFMMKLKRNSQLLLDLALQLMGNFLVFLKK